MTNITTLPDRAFKDFKRLRRLRLASNMLTSLPPNAFSGLKHLTYLTLQGNQLRTVPAQAIKDLVNLETLYLDNNLIPEVPDHIFTPLRNLRGLRLDANLITQVPVFALNQAKELTAIDLAQNSIEEIPDYAFYNLTNLAIVVLSGNRISHIGPHAFDGLPVLSMLELDRNMLTQIPSALHALPDLIDLTMIGNRIEYVADGCFSGNKKLALLKLNENPITNIGVDAFMNLPELEELALSEAREMIVFPNLHGTYNVKIITLDRASITVLPHNLCKALPQLSVLDVHANHITVIPNMTDCSFLALLNLGNNDITTLENRPLEGLDNLKDLILNYNQITSINARTFAGLTKLQYLDLSYNKIGYIHPEAFASLVNLEDLNLGENNFAVLPTKGLANLRFLKTFHNRYLEEPPSYDSLPNIVLMVTAYAYHCCAFIRSAEKQPDVAMLTFSQDIEWLNANANSTDFWQADNSTSSLEYPYYGSIYDDMTNCTIDGVNITNCNNNYNYDPGDAEAAITAVETVVKARPPVQCSPLPDPFQPCDDLFGWWWLRCGVWVVFLLAVMGNGTVLFVSVFSKSKLDVTRFLICNLAFSDLCMGIYLGFLAIVDASTLGAFEKYAVRWQSSPWCLIAGFLGVLSSELSVFTLVVITVERFYAISHAMQLDKRVRLGHAGIAMACGWVICIVMASLPLFEISDYRKFAICLPFETGNSISRAYVCFIMLFNAVSFLIIVICYGCMFVSIRASHSWTNNDTVVAKRMAVLVFTDFICWAPIIFFTLTATFGFDFLSLNEAKVLTIFVLPWNSCANPFLYAIFTRQFRKDCEKLCKRIEELGISRHLSSSGMGRSSAGAHRHGAHHRVKRESCDHLMNEPSTSGEASSSSNNQSEDSDITFRKMQLTAEERQILRYVRSETTPARPIRIIHEDSFDRRCPGYINLVPVRRSRNLVSTPKRATDDDMESGPDIILHTNDGNVYLSAKSKNRMVRGKAALKSKSADTNTCAKRLCHHTKQQNQSQSPVSTRSRTVESQTVDASDGITDKIVQADDETSAAVVRNIESVRKKFEAERSKELGLKGERFIGSEVQQNMSFESDLKLKTIATQTDINFEIQSAKLYNLQKAMAKREKDKHINEWRKTSHLSFLWRNSATFDAVTQKQKSNSLVELARPPVTHMQNTPNKRHSLTSKQEGYILLKNASRDSAYEDDEMYEFYEAQTRPVEVSVNNKPKQTKTCVQYHNTMYDGSSSNKKGDVAKQRSKTFCLDNDEVCETSILLTDNLCLPPTRNSCDNESGISSSS